MDKENVKSSDIHLTTFECRVAPILDGLGQTLHFNNEKSTQKHSGFVKKSLLMLIRADSNEYECTSPSLPPCESTADNFTNYLY